MNTKILAAVISLSLAASVNTAQASALATAYLDISDFKIFKNDTTTPINSGTDIGSLVYNSNGSVAASLTGYGAITSGTVFSPGAATGLDMFAALGAGTGGGSLDGTVGAPGTGFAPNGYTENNPSSHLYSSTTDPINNFSFGDQLEQGAPITGIAGVPTAGAHIFNESTAGMTGQGTAGAGSNNGLVADWTFTALTGDFLTFSFNLSAYLETFVSNDLVAPSTANAAASQIFTLIDTTTGALVPLTGASALIFNSGANSPADNGIAHTFLNPVTHISMPIGTPFSGAFSFTSGALTAGNRYELTANILTSATVRAVPEPGILALMGAGLLGMAGMRRRQVG